MDQNLGKFAIELDVKQVGEAEKVVDEVPCLEEAARDHYLI